MSRSNLLTLQRQVVYRGAQFRGEREEDSNDITRPAEWAAALAEVDVYLSLGLARLRAAFSPAAVARQVHPPLRLQVFALGLTSASRRHRH